MKLLKKILSFISVFSLLFYQVAFPLVILAQEATASADISTPVPTETQATSSAQVEPSPSLTPSPESSPSPTPQSLWTQTDGRYTTQTLQPDVTYKFPPNEKVSLTFTKLPEASGTVTVQEIKLTEEQVKETGALLDTAYEITSTMLDGTFEYTLTLPAPQTENVEVKVSEDGQTFQSVEGEVVQSDTITISGLTHFTIFVIAGIINEFNVGEAFDESGSDILINEFLYNPSSGNEWIELYNRTGDPIDLSGWRLEDAGPISDLDLSGEIPAGGRAVFEHSSGWLNNTGDTISLENSDGDLIDRVTYKQAGTDTVDAQDIGNVAAGQSVGRIRDGWTTEDAIYFWGMFPTPTKGDPNHSIVYVDGSFGGAEFGTFNHPFNSLQGGINVVSEGGTVNVAGGEYEESLTIGQPLTLLGDPGNEDAGPGEDAPTIFGDCSGDPVVSVEANDVTVSGFIIIEDDCDGSNIYINGSTSGATISDNDINEASYYGVELGSGSSDNQILRNLIHDNGDFGIYNYGSTNTTISENDNYNNYGGIGMGGSGDVSGTQITNNNIHDNYNTGIYASGVTFSDLTISQNDITTNQGYGIYFDGISEGNLTISDNTVTDNDSTGIYLSGGGGQIINSTVTISDNTVSNNDSDGIYIDVVVDSTVDILENTVSSNSSSGIYLCAEGECSNSTLNINQNSVSENGFNGVYLYSIFASTVTLDDNEILSNSETGLYFQYIGTPLDPSTVTVTNNTISSNGSHGIYLYSVDEVSEVEIGSGNTVSSNGSSGIYLDSQVTGVEITGNTITDNGLGEILFTGIVVISADGNQAHNNIISGNNVGVNNQDEDGNDFDAKENYWGADSGPLHETTNPEGQGNAVTDNVLYRPFYTDEERTTLSTNSVDPDDLSSLLDSGSFDIPDDEDSESASQLTVNEDLTINVSDSGGTSSVVLPSGTVITNEDGTIDVPDITSDDVSESSLAGLGTGVVVDGALQWGLDDIELTFSQPITLNIFVGTALNGQTLSVVRSTTGSSGWTSDGIVAPATCVVTAGVCSFQATKASFYATTHTSAPTVVTATSATQALSAASGSVPPPSCSDTKPGSAPTLLSTNPSGSNQVTLTWSKAKDPVTYYLITYGLSAGSQQYGNPNVGGPDATSYTVQGLSGGTTYYFKVRAGNGCAPGDYSNELSATPGGEFIAGPAEGFAPGVQGATTDQDVGLGEVQEEATPSATQPPVTASPQGEAGQSPFPVRTVVVIVIVLLLGFGVFKLLVK